ILKPGEKLPQDKLEELKKINDAVKKTKNFSKYLIDLRKLFQIDEVQVTSESKLFLAGFLEGEASLNISTKKLATSKFGLVVDPEFNVTRHVNGVKVLYLALEVFKTGRIRHKSGSNATLVLTIDNRQSLEEKVIPFYEQYVVAFSSPEKVKRVANFKALLELFNNDAHQDLEQLVNKILPIWDQMRKQQGQSNEGFPNLEAAQDFAR
uniref:DNA endonuclease I-CeuI n=1 Tax=Chlamydomonas moewusii TaxID=3054 RepID=UPI0000D7CC0D|nr:Chain A, DNA endonuclease I-CeuI [Chlamydomonas moewusii]2EX5_B Chain B, DNA endonuclease I-CeuI [Chlamydomonas moewusii]